MTGIYRVECAVQLNRVEGTVLLVHKKDANITFGNTCILKWLVQCELINKHGNLSMNCSHPKIVKQLPEHKRKYRKSDQEILPTH